MIVGELRPRSYDDSKATCAGQRSHIAISDGLDEAAAITAVITFDPPNPYYRVGVDDLAQPGTWMTVLGVPATYLPWGPGQPNGGSRAIPPRL